MATINEDYVSYETARLLKEKGFNGEDSPFYSEQDRDEWIQNNSYSIPNPNYNTDIPFDSETITMVAPHISLQMAMKWLREKHNVHVQIEYERHAGYNKYGYTSTLIFTDDLSQTYVTWKPSYEEAAEFAIKYYLENPT